MAASATVVVSKEFFVWTEPMTTETTMDTEGWQLTGRLRYVVHHFDLSGTDVFALQQQWSRPKRNGEPGLDYEWRNVPVELET